MKIEYSKQENPVTPKPWDQFELGELFYCFGLNACIYVRVRYGVVQVAAVDAMVCPSIYDEQAMESFTNSDQCLPAPGKVTLTFGKDGT